MWRGKSSECRDTDIIGYNIYYADGYDSEFGFLTFTENPQYIHENLPSFIGCYIATAIDFSGNESDSSTIVCNDNCPMFELPNVFTPNEDGYNDVYTELNSEGSAIIPISECPRFVKNVEFFVYNRYGTQVYNYKSLNTENCWIEWSGVDDRGKKVSSGICFYDAKITYDVLDPDNSIDHKKEWIHVLY